MILGFHYHAPAIHVNGTINTSGFIGVFIDSIASECDQLILFLHTPTNNEVDNLDYSIKSKNVELVSIGIHYPLYFRIFITPFHIRKIRDHLILLDKFLIRSPTPMMFSFLRYIDLKNVSLYLVSDYVDGAKSLNLPIVRKRLIQLWAWTFQKHLVKLLSKVNVISNSIELQKKFSNYNSDIKIVRTSTLSSDSFYKNTSTSQKSRINCIYTGRIDLGKGLIEIVNAIASIRKDGLDFHLSIAGWDGDKHKRSTISLKHEINSLGIHDYIHFLGKKKIGKDLNQVYRDGDIYLLCSQFSEGFPRTIWEAMANSLPVIATRVGSIPYFLENEKNAILINPRDIDGLKTAMLRLVDDSELRMKVISNAYNLAKDNTLKSQARRLIKNI